MAALPMPRSSDQLDSLPPVASAVAIPTTLGTSFLFLFAPGSWALRGAVLVLDFFAVALLVDDLLLLALFFSWLCFSRSFVSVRV